MKEKCLWYNRRKSPSCINDIEAVICTISNPSLEKHKEEDISIRGERRIHFRKPKTQLSTVAAAVHCEKYFIKRLLISIKISTINILLKNAI